MNFTKCCLKVSQSLCVEILIPSELVLRDEVSQKVLSSWGPVFMDEPMLLMWAH